MPNKKFLEQFPLYRKFQNNFYGDMSALEKVAVHMDCHVCKSGQTFLMANQYHEGYSYANTSVENTEVHCRYLCTSCKGFERHFYLRFGPGAKWVMKIGQYPAWDITADPTLEKALGEDVQLYKKGLICESQAYGVGAFAYYRRIVEEIIDDLLNDIALLLTEAEKPAYLEALEKAKSTKVTQDKIELVKDLLPPILRPDGMNPLAVLHNALSEGLHARTDDECLELAVHVREGLVFLANQVAATRDASKQFTESMRKLLKRHGGKSA